MQGAGQTGGGFRRQGQELIAEKKVILAAIGFYEAAAILGALFCIVLFAVYCIFNVVDDGLKQMARLETDTAYRAETLAGLDEKIRLAPGKHNLYLQRANVRRFSGDHAGVVEDLAKYLEHDPRDDSAWFELAEALLALGKAEEALGAIDRALALDENYADYYPVKIRAALVAEKPDKADDAMEKWEELEQRLEDADRGRKRPQMLAGRPLSPFVAHPALPLYRAMILLQRGDKDEAAAIAREALKENDAVNEFLHEDRFFAPLKNLGDNN